MIRIDEDRDCKNDTCSNIVRDYSISNKDRPVAKIPETKHEQSENADIPCQSTAATIGTFLLFKNKCSVQ